MEKARSTFNKKMHGAQLLPLRGFTHVNSSVLQDCVFEFDGLIMVQWIQQFHSLNVTC